MKVQTEIRIEDYNAFLRLVYAKTLRPWANVLWTMAVFVPIAILAGILFGIGGLPGGDKGVTLVLGGFVAGIGFLYLLGILVSRDQRKRISPADGGYILGPQEVELNAEGARVRSGQHEALFRWSLIGPPDVTPEYVFIMIDRIAGIIIPRGSFASDAECNAFIDEVRARKQKG
jgi:hypothetical protein